MEEKLVVAEAINSFSKEQVEALVAFQERFFRSEVIMLDYLRSSIRNTVRAVIRRKEQVLFLEETLKGETYFFLPGGGVEFKETAQQAVGREVSEELGLTVTGAQHLRTIDNIFEIEGMTAHEVSQIFEVSVAENELPEDGALMSADVLPCRIRWLTVEDLRDGKKKVYPKELLDVL